MQIYPETQKAILDLVPFRHSQFSLWNAVECCASQIWQVSLAISESVPMYLNYPTKEALEPLLLCFSWHKSH